jgi:two-component system, LuxR family, response regulator FixJ
MRANYGSDRHQAGVDVLLVTHDPSVLKTLGSLLMSNGFSLTAISDPANLIPANLIEVIAKSSPRCVVLEMQLPPPSGPDLLSQLRSQFADASLIAISRKPSVSLAVDAMRKGAIDFFRVPIDSKRFLDRIREVIESPPVIPSPDTAAQPEFRFAGQYALSAREREVLRQIALGASSKEAGRRLGISPRTIDAHRARIMEKLGVKRSVDLVRLVLGATGEVENGQVNADERY